MMNITPVVKQLLIINIIFFIGTQFAGPASYDILAMVYVENPKFQFWQILSHMFMHGSVTHIAFNMFALYSFGSALEQTWGGQKFLFFYISCGLGSVVLHTLVNYFMFENAAANLIANGITRSEIIGTLSEGQYRVIWNEYLNPAQLQSLIDSFTTPVVGASGAIYGLLVAFAFMYPNAKLSLLFLPIGIKAKYFVTGILLLDLFLGLKGGSIFGGGGTGIAHFAHIGGAIVGFIMMYIWKKNEFDNHRWN